ncbi:TolC family protein [Mitsuaria sp. WAJ17]|uniref:TolC family protein n=1 Tax=Mitsuaria sp. WAJ17 TaxID=2761452 RepID=UPI00160317E5|nr:TolC family protein [Mitsuaria sp. WAJ17]MBB2486593.1 TolC family protein [Mitsuaria sp. WAJ17]
MPDPSPNPRARAPGARLALAAAASLLLGACAVQAPTPPAGTAPAMPAVWQAPLPADGVAALPEWLQSSDPVLRAVLEAVQAQAPSLQQAVARRDEIRALAGVDPGGPRVQGLAQLQRTRAVLPANSPVLSQGLTQIDASWELDLFARVRQQSQALARRAEAAQWELQAVRLSLMVEVAQLYLTLRSAEQAQALALEEEGITERLAAQAAQRQRAGLETPAQQALLAGVAAESRQRRLAQQLELEALHKALVAATGMDEALLRRQLAPGRGQLPSWPALALRAVPAEAVQLRPDLMAARMQALAAWSEAGAAQAARYPQLQLLGSISVAGVKLGSERDESRGWSLGPQLSLPLLDGGARRAEAEAAQARWRQAEAAWRGTALQAVREVEEALLRLAAQQARVEAAQASLASYEKALKGTEQRWRHGLASASELDEQRRLTLAARSLQLQLQREGLSACLSLYKAVGGGFKPA